MGFRTGEKCWDTGVEQVKSCELEDKTDAIVILPSTLHRKIVVLSETMDGQEWLGYLVGKEEPRGTFVITGLEVPKQTVTSGHVDVDEPILRVDIIGTVHSHHSMGAFFSTTDDNYVGANHTVMIVYGTKAGYKAKVKRELKCGAFIYKDAELKVTVPNPPDLAKFVANAKRMITESVYTPPYVQGKVNLPHHQKWGNRHWKKGQQPRLFCRTCHKEIEGEIYWINDIMLCESCFYQSFGYAGD